MLICKWILAIKENLATIQRPREAKLKGGTRGGYMTLTEKGE